MMPVSTSSVSLRGLLRRLHAGPAHTARLMRPRHRRRAFLRAITAALAALALAAAVLTPAASAQVPNIGTVVIAYGYSSADSAVASALAALESDNNSRAVVLYTDKNSLHTLVADFIRAHRPSEVILVGGKKVLTENVRTQVAAQVSSARIRRIEGTDRFDTAAKAVPSSATTYIVANGYSAADTGVAAAVAATKNNAAVLLAESDNLTEHTERILRDQPPLAVEFVGGTTVLAASLTTRVRELVPSIRNIPRHFGPSRTDTAAAAAPDGSTTVVIANGWRAADMGVAAAYAAITSRAAVLYSRTTSLTTATERRIQQLQPTTIVLVGGNDALNTSLHARLHVLAPRAAIKRISGANRIDTSVRAADGRLSDVATEPPAKPTLVTTTPRDAGLAVSWTAPKVTSGTSSVTDTSVTGYAVQYRACTATPKTCTASPTWSNWTSSPHAGVGTAATITGLTNDTTYEVRIAARNSAGLSEYSTTASGTPVARTSTPSGVTVEAASRHLKVSWQPPSLSSGTSLVGYEVQYGACGSTTAGCSPSWANQPHSGTGTTAEIPGLINGTVYQVRVRALTSKEVTGWSPTASGTPAQVPSFEKAPKLTPGDHRIVVQWNAPDDSRGLSIRGYGVQYRACISTNSDTKVLTCNHAENNKWSDSWKSLSHSGTATKATITSLANGTAYQVQVRASNSNGPGPWSEAARATPVAVPEQPSGVTVEAGHEKLIVTWTAPFHNGSAITEYDIQHCTGTCASNSLDWQDAGDPGTATRYEIASLANNTTYTVRVQAINGIGNGPWSSIKSGKPRALPNAPAAPTLTAGNKKIDVAWDEPTAVANVTINDYDVQYRYCTATPRTCTAPHVSWETSWRTSNVSVTVADRTAAITKLTNGTATAVRVRARSSGGAGPWSAAAQKIPLGKPLQPAAPTLTTGDTKLIVRWTAPGSNGSPITSYEVAHCVTNATCADDTDDWKTNNTTITFAENTAEITNLTNDTSYKVRVRAVNAVGKGPWSSTRAGTPTVRPLAPGAPTLEEGNRSLSVSWSEPGTQGVTITDYDVQYRACISTGNDKTNLTCTSSPKKWGDWRPHNHSGVTRATTITGLTNGTAYQVQVRAGSNNGVGDWSLSSEKTPVAVPSKPSNVVVDAAHTQLSVSWTASIPNGSTGITYEVQYRACTATPKTCSSKPTWTDWTTANATVSGTTASITGLTNSTKYQVQVQANGSKGKSGWTDSKSATPTAVPNAPTALNSTAEDSQITVSWTAPGENGFAINGYVVEYRDCTVTPRDCSSNPSWGVWTTHSHLSTSTTTTITGLINGIKHEVRVRARNSNGLGPWSAIASGMPIGKPAAPSAPTVSTSNTPTNLDVSWFEPRSNGTTIDGYDVQYRPCIATNSDITVLTCTNNPAWGDWSTVGVAVVDTTATITGLTDGTKYEVQVRAKDGSVLGEWSSSANGTPVDKPMAPIVSLTSGGGKLIVTWPVPNARGSTISGYKVQRCSGSCANDSDWTQHSITGTSTTRTFTGLTNGTSYKVRVKATSKSRHGDSDWSATVTRNAGAPNAPSNVRLTAGDTEISVTWSVPGSNGSNIDDYEVKHCLSTLDCTLDTNWIDAPHTGTTATHTITGLVNGKAYKVRVRAQNGNGWGAWSSTPSTTPSS